MLIIPPATARLFARTLESMAIIAAGIGSVSALAGLCRAYILDTPTGPSIVCVSAVLFASFGLVSALTNRGG